MGEKNRGLAMGINEFAGYLVVGVAAYLSAGIAGAKGFAFYPFVPGILFSVVEFFLTVFFVKDTAFVHQEAKENSIPSGYVIGTVLSGIIADQFGIIAAFISVAIVTAAAGLLAEVRMCCMTKLIWESQVC